MPLIGNRQCRSVHQIENRFRDAGLEPRIVFRSDDNGTIQELVAAGVGVALVPLLTVDPAHEGTGGHRPRRRAAAPDRDRLAPRPLPLAGGSGLRRARPGGGARVEADQSGAAPRRPRAARATRRSRSPARGRSRPRSARGRRPALDEERVACEPAPVLVTSRPCRPEEDDVRAALEPERRVRADLEALDVRPAVDELVDEAACRLAPTNSVTRIPTPVYGERGHAVARARRRASGGARRAPRET